MREIINDNTRNHIIVLLLFTVISLILIISHEPWRDEAQAWLIVRDAKDLIEILRLMGYEGTPALWHIILYPFARANFPFAIVSIIHFLFAFSTAYLIVKYSPFSMIQKIMIIFGYYFLYEYNIIARSYAISVFLLFSLAVVYKSRFEKPFIYCLLIGLLVNTNVHSLVFGLILSGLFFYELSTNDQLKDSKKFLPLLITIAAIIIAILQLLPPADLAENLKEWKTKIDRIYLISVSMYGSFIPITNDKWNYLKIFNFYSIGLYIISFLILCCSYLFLIKKKIPMTIYFLNLSGLLTIFVIKYIAGFRHFGLIFIIFIFSYWISHYYEDENIDKKFLFQLFISFFISLGVLMFFIIGYIILSGYISFGLLFTILKLSLAIFPLLFCLFMITTWYLNDDVLIKKVDLLIKNVGTKSIIVFEKIKHISSILPNKLLATRIMTMLLSVMLLFQLFGTIIIINYDISHDFSEGKKVAIFLTENNLINDSILIITYKSPLAASVIVQLPNPNTKFYFLEYEQFGSYMIWNNKYWESRDLDNEEILRRINRITINSNYERVIVILTIKTDVDIFNSKFELIASFDDNSIEKYDIYDYHF